MSPVSPLEPWQTAWPALPALLMVLWGVWGLRRELRVERWGALVLLLALLVRVVWVPLERHEFDGHEAEYRDLFLGARALGRGGTLLYPAMQWLYAGLGIVLEDPRWLIVFSTGISLLGIAATMGAVRRLWAPGPALAAGLLLALWGDAVFWASSAYNVILPHTLLAVGLWALAALIDGARPGAAGALAGGAFALAVATRVEGALVAPSALLLLGLYRPPAPGRWAPGLILGGLLGVAAMALVLSAGEAPGADARAASFWMNLGILAYFAPFDAPITWPALAVGAAIGLVERPKLAVPLLLLLPGLHLASATFDDYGVRHLLNAGFGLGIAAGGLTARRWAWPLALLLIVPMMQDLGDLRRRYYTSEERFAEALDPALPRINVAELPACALIVEDFRVVPEELQRSHFNLLDAAEAEALRAEGGGCLWWLYGVQDHRLSSRAVRDRAIRTMLLYETKPVAVVIGPERGYVGLTMEIGNRRALPLVPALAPVESP